MRPWARRIGALALLLLSACAAEAQPNFGNWRKNKWPRGSVPDIFTLLPDAPALDDQCAGDALASIQGTAVTFARASQGYCTGGDGAMILMAVDAPRLQANGVLREGARTNIALRSQALDNASWQTVGFNVASPTVTPNAAVAPDGTTTAEQIEFPAVSGATKASAVYQDVTLTAAAYTESFYVMGASGTGAVYLYFNPDAVTYRSAACAWNSTTWTRCSVTGNGTAATWGVRIGNDTRDAAQSGGIAAQTIYVWQGQMELGGFASSAIVTAGTSATRATETITATVPDDIDTEGCLAATVTYGATFPSGHNLVGTDQDGLGASDATTLAVGDGTSTPATITVPSMLSTSTTARAYWRDSGPVMGVASSGQEDSTDFSGSMSTDNVITIGGAGTFFGELRNVRASTSAGGCR